MEFDRRKRVDLAGLSTWIVSLEDLILSKLYWAKDSFSELQIRDIKTLLSSGNQIDFAYLNRWINELELNSIYRKVQNG